MGHGNHTSSHHHAQAGKGSGGSSKHQGSGSGSGKHHTPSSKSLGSSVRDAPEIPPSFLFVVNEFVLGQDFTNFTEDTWENLGPPTSCDDYTSEAPSYVFRYYKDRVSVAPEYSWFRHGMGQPGAIVRYEAGYVDADGSPIPIPMAAYQTRSVFSCSPLVPVVVAEGDASLGNTFVRGNPTETGTSDGLDVWNALHFHGSQEPELAGVSFASSTNTGRPTVVGRNPSWMPSLVPQVFANHRASPGARPRESQGLSGELGILIGLMAFHGPRYNASHVFGVGQNPNQMHVPFWDRRRWMHGQRTRNNPPVWPAFYADAPMRGFMVQICYDHLFNEFGSTEGSLSKLEWATVLVSEEGRAETSSSGSKSYPKD